MSSMKTSLKEMTDEQAQAILDLLARKVGFTHAKIEVEATVPEYLSMTLYHSSHSRMGDGVFYKIEDDCFISECYVIAKKPFKYGVSAKTALDGLLRSSAEGIEFSVNGWFAEPEHGIEVFMHAGTTLEELLVKLDLEA